MISSAFLYMLVQNSVTADVKLVTEFQVGKDPLKPAIAFARLCSGNQVEFPLSVEAEEAFEKESKGTKRFALSAVKADTFESNLWASSCRPKLSKSKTREYVISSKGIHCFARVTSEVLAGYLKVLKLSSDKGEWTIASAICMRQLSRLNWSVKKAGKTKLPGYDTYLKTTNMALAKYPAGTFDENRNVAVMRWKNASQELNLISASYLAN